jgi:hypothetical protein
MAPDPEPETRHRAQAPARDRSGVAPERDRAELAMRTCPVCGAELAERKCKLYCPRPGCGYYLSCADFY